MRTYLAIGLVVLGLAACSGEQEVLTEPAAEPAPEPVTVTVEAEAPATTEAETTTEEAPEPKSAGVGDSINVAGYESGYRVTLVRIDKSPRHEPYFGPSRGNHYFAAYIQVQVTDGSPTNVCAGNDASVIDSQGQTFTGDYGAVEPDFGCPTIRVGAKRAGWITFEVPKGSKIVTFQYTPDSGFAEQTGEWQL